MIDVVITTCDRLKIFKTTLAYILARTVTPYRLHVIDDASRKGKRAYLSELKTTGQINLLQNRNRVGIPTILRLVSEMGSSDPMVFTDDDVLCPLVEPDWLEQGLRAMSEFPKLGLLALNSPQCNIDHKRGEVRAAGQITFCRNVPGTFVFARRAVMKTCLPPMKAQSPVKAMCRLAREQGWAVGYLTNVFCQHIGEKSMRWSKKSFKAELDLVWPVDPDTLAPPEEYRW